MPNAKIDQHRIHYHVCDGCAIVRPEGPCNTETAEALGRLVNSPLIESKHLIVDLSRTDYIETPGYRWLVRQLRELESAGKTLMVAGLPRSIERTFKLLKLDKSIPIAEDVSEALERVRGADEPVPLGLAG